MLQTAAETDDLAAVVSEGAGTRKFGETMEEFARPGEVDPGNRLRWSHTVGTALFSSTHAAAQADRPGAEDRAAALRHLGAERRQRRAHEPRVLPPRARPEAALDDADGQACTRYLRPTEGVRDGA